MGANAVVYVREFLPLLPWQQSLLLSLGPILIGILDYPLGNVADYWGIKRTMVCGFFIVGIASLVYSLSKDFSILLMSIVFIAIGTALISGTGQSWLHHALSDKHELFKKSLSRGVVISRSTNLLAALFAPVLISFSQNMPFMAHGGCFVFGAIILALFVGNDFKIDLSAKKNPSFYYFFKSNTAHILKSVLLRKIMLITVCEMIFLAVFLFSWQILISKEFSNHKEMLGFVYVILRASLLGVGLVFHKLRKNISYRGVIKCYQSLVIVGSILLFFHGAWLICGLIILEIAIGLISHQNSLLFNELITSEVRTSVFSAISTIASLALALTFFVMNYFSTEFVLKGLIFVCLVAGMGIVRGYKRIM